MKNKIVVTLLSLFSFFSGKAHAGPAFEEKTHKALIQSAKQIGKAHQLSYLTIGLGDIISRNGIDTTPWGLVWTCQRKLSLEEAKEMARQIAMQMLDNVQKSSICMNFRQNRYAYRQETMNKTVDSKRLQEEANKTGPNDLSFRISFWDENMDRLMPPYIAEVDFIGGELFYYVADPVTLALQEEARETLSYTWGLVKK
jgi:hypothetical protein